MIYFLKENRKNTLYGLIFVIAFAKLASFIASIPFMAHVGMSPLVVAIILGIIYGNTKLHPKISANWTLGIQFSAKYLLRLSIIFYGFRVSFQQIAAVGVEGLLLDIFVVSTILIGGSWIGIKFFKLDRHLAILIASGSAICGAAAVLAVEGVMKSESYKSSIAVGTVILFGTFAMFFYPFLQHEEILSLNFDQFGIFIGASIHEVAQALVAGSSVNVHTGNIAVIVKMTRVLLLIPALILLSLYENKRKAGNQSASVVPWFAVLFAAAIGFNSLHLLSKTAIDIINIIDLFLLTMAMAAIGIETNINKIKKIGLKPLYFAITIFFWLGGSTYMIVRYI